MGSHPRRVSCQLAKRRGAIGQRPPLDLGLELAGMISRVSLFASLDRKAITEVGKRLRALVALAGEKIVSILTTAPGSTNAIGGVKVIAENGWFAARPSGTEDIYKLYAESFLGADHLKRIQAEAQEIIERVFRTG